MTRRWTQEEDDLLHKLYPHHPTPDLVERFGRNQGSIRNRARIYGLKKTPQANAKAHRDARNRGRKTQFENYRRRLMRTRQGPEIVGSPFHDLKHPRMWVTADIDSKTIFGFRIGQNGERTDITCDVPFKAAREFCIINRLTIHPERVDFKQAYNQKYRTGFWTYSLGEEL